MELLGDIKEDCIDIYNEMFIDIFHKTLNIHAPLPKQSRKETKLKNKPWLSKGILISIQQKNLLYKRALKLNDSNTWAQYKVYRNKLTHIKEYAKRLYIKNLVNDNKHDTLSLWKIINKIIHLKNVKKNNIPNKMYASKSESAQGPLAISNLFNKYFIEIGVNLASTIETPAIIDGKFNATSLIQSSCNSFFLEPIVEEEVVNYIRAMNPSKSTGRHGIPAKYIKMSGSVIAPVLTNIFNACISTGYFPKVLKTAEVVPIFKKGERELCSNYQRWSRGHKARGQGRGQGQGQGHKKNPRPRPRTAFPRTDTLEAKDRNARGRGQGPRTQSASALQKKKKKGLQKKKKKGLHKNFSGNLQKKKKKKKSSQKFFKRSPLKNVFQKIFQPLHKFLTFQKIVLSSS